MVSNALKLEKKRSKFINDNELCCREGGLQSVQFTAKCIAISKFTHLKSSFHLKKKIKFALFIDMV